MFNGAALLEILIEEMPTLLECTAEGCNHGKEGARWKTPALETQYALEMLNRHRADVH